jgi:hypothetical protein
MAPAAPNNRWLVYSCKTRTRTHLDHSAYPSTLFDGQPIPWPPWACKAPDGRIHISNVAQRVDVELAERPRTRAELHWTWDFGVRLIADSWLDEIRDLIDESRTFLGDVRVAGKKVVGWSTLHEPGAPPLLASEGKSKSCSICGNY